MSALWVGYYTLILLKYGYPFHFHNVTLTFQKIMFDNSSHEVSEDIEKLLNSFGCHIFFALISISVY